MPYGYKYPKGKDILGKINQGELSDVPDGKLYREGLQINTNQKVKQGDLGSESGAVGKKEKVDASIFKKAEERDY